MPDLILSDSRLDTMEGYYPNRKPVGNVKIDWDHPLAKGLTLCMPMQMTGAVDLVSGKKAEYYQGAKDVPYGVYFDEVNDYMIMPDVRMTEDYSITWDIDYTDNLGNLYQYLLSYGATSGEGNFQVFLGEVSGGLPDKLKAYQNDSAINFSLTGATTHPETEVPTTVCTTGTDGSLYLNGHLDVSSATFGSLPMIEGNVQDLHIGARSDLNAGRLLGGIFKFLFIHNRKLSAAEIESLHNNPYQFLIPAG